MPLFDACCSNDATIGRATSSRSTSRRSSLSCPDSARACSSSWPTRAVSRSTCASACGTNRSRASSSGASSTVSSISLIDESGVRSSCETFERNSLRARSSRTKRRLIVGEDHDPRRVAAFAGQRIDGDAIGALTLRAASKCSGATDASPRKCVGDSPLQLDVGNRFDHVQMRSPRVWSKPNVVPAAAFANSTRRAASTRITPIGSAPTKRAKLPSPGRRRRLAAALPGLLRVAVRRAALRRKRHGRAAAKPATSPAANAASDHSSGVKL